MRKHNRFTAGNMVNRPGNSDVIGDMDSNTGPGQSLGWVSESLALILWRNRFLVLAVTIAALIAALIYVTTATPIYTSESRIYVEQSGPKIFSETEEGVMTQSKNYLYTQAELLKSTPILAEALDSQAIRQMRTFAHVDNPVSYLKKNLNPSVGKRDDIISVSFDSPYPTEAAQLVNAVVDSYITDNARRKKSTSSEVLKILQTEKARRSKELMEKLKALVDYKNDNPALALEDRQGSILLEQLQRWSDLLTEARITTIESESALETAKAMADDPVKLKQFVDAQRARGAYASGDGERTELVLKLDRLETNLANRLCQVTADHPAVSTLIGQIDHVKKQIADLDSEFVQAELAVTEQRYLAAKQKESQIAGYYEDQRKQAEELSQQLTQYTLLQSDWEQTKKDCDMLDDRIKEVNVTEDVGALNISILEYARPADKPSQPQKARYMAISLVMGLVLGGGLALFRNLADQKMRSAEEISAVLEMPVLGVVPSMPGKEGPSIRGRKAYLDSKSRWAEAYRTIRTAVFFGAPKGEAKIILVTSPTPSDGKSTLASNLGITMAQAEQKTIILDADFRKPMQHKIHRLNHADRGLSSILAGTTTLEEAVCLTEVDNLAVLASGPSVPNPAEILNSESFTRLLELISAKYDRVIVDSPPIMPVTDSQILGALCDITLMVLRADKSTRRVSLQARDGLLSVGTRVLGVVVNDAPRNGRSGYYGYYGYYGEDHGVRRKRKHGKAAILAKDSRMYADSND